MKLYTIPVSPNCRRAEAVVHYLDLDVEILSKDLFNGELDSNEFKQLNPNGKVPVLVDDDYTVWESNVIMQYLTDCSNNTDFFPKELKQRTHIIKWQFWESLHFNKAVGAICWETVAKPKMNIGEADQKIIDASMDDFNKYASVLDAQLKDKKFIMGDNVTVADFSVGSHSALVLYPNSQIPLEKYPNLSGWFNRLESIPAWNKTKPPFS